MNPLLEELLAEKEKDRILAASKDAAKSGALSGGALGGLKGALSHGGGKSAAIQAAIGALGGAGIAGGGTYLGSQLLGAPEEDEPGGFTNRGALGGAIAGGAGGLGLGALLGGGGLRWLSRVPGVAAKASNAGETLLGRGVKALMKGPNPGKRTAAALGVGGALGGGLYGGGEGMQLDYLETLDDEDGRHGSY